MKYIIGADKGIDVYDVASQVEEATIEMLNKEFEGRNGKLKSNIKITIRVEVEE